MPRKDRIKSSIDKEREKAATAKGQKTIDFIRTSRAISTTPADQTTHHQAESTTSLDDRFSVFSAAAHENVREQDVNTEENLEKKIFIKSPDEFTSEDKALCENKGRYFQKEWMEDFPWLIYNREKKSAFCNICIDFSAKDSLKKS